MWSIVEERLMVYSKFTSTS